jgi:hypothetical protein
MEDFPETPLLVSVWGNDFTLHAQATPWMSRYTQRTLGRADALHTDCQRDLHLARQLGFPINRPSMVLPGNGGIHLEVFYPPPAIHHGQMSVINPRGFRAYVRNDIFFKSVSMVLSAQPGVKFSARLCKINHKRIAGYGNMEFRRMLSCYPG